MPILITLYSILFLFLAWRNFRLALGLFIIALPSYLIRFKIGPLPTTLLEFNFGLLFLVWLIKYARHDLPHLKYLIVNYKVLTVAIFVFLASSLVGIFISDMWWASLGQWRAYWLEPMLAGVVLAGRLVPPRRQTTPGLEADPSPRPARGGLLERRGWQLTPTDVILLLALSTIPVSIMALIQKFTGALYPPSLWDDELMGRVTSFFTSPNAAGLYLAPLILLILPLLASRLPRGNRSFTTYWLLLATLLAALTLLFTKSLGAGIAVGSGLLLIIYLLNYKKAALVVLAAGIALAVSVFPYFSLAKSQSLTNRLALWQYSSEYLTASPKNFIFGAGIRQFFRKIQKPHYDAKELERLIYPHNIWLNFWTEIGLFGLLGFIGIYYALGAAAYSLYQHTDKFLGAGLLAALAAILVHGLIDVPYFKNDLAMVFWILAAVIISAAPPEKQKIPGPGQAGD